MKVSNYSKEFTIDHISWLDEKFFRLKSLILRFGLKSCRLNVLHPSDAVFSCRFIMFATECFLEMIDGFPNFVKRLTRLKCGNWVSTVNNVCVAIEFEAMSFSFRLSDCVPRSPFGFEVFARFKLVLPRKSRHAMKSSFRATTKCSSQYAGDWGCPTGCLKN